MPARGLRGTPVGWRDGTRDGRPLRWPCCASRTLATVSAPRSTLPTIHTSRLALPGPIRSSAARRSYALTIPALFYVAYVLPNRCFSNCLVRLLSQNPAPDPTRGVALLAWRSTIGFQDSVDEWNQRPEHRLFAFGPLPLRWLCVRECLSHQPPVNAQLACDPQHRSHPEVVFPPYLLE